MDHEHHGHHSHRSVTAQAHEHHTEVHKPEGKKHKMTDYQGHDEHAGHHTENF